METDKIYCMSSFLAFRYVVDKNKQFYDGFSPRRYCLITDHKRIMVNSAVDIDMELQKFFDSIKNKKIAILLSGGMDSAILASYMSGCDAYTFRFDGGSFQSEELERAKMFAERNNLKLHYVDIDWNVVEKSVDFLMKTKNAPVHSIEPQIYEAAEQAKKDGIDIMIIGDAADYVFYGMDGLLSKDWTFDEFYKRFIYIEPSSVLNCSFDVHSEFEKYRTGNRIDFLSMYDEITTEESYASYENAFFCSGLKYIDPYEVFKMKDKVDLTRIRHGESKYLIRELFKMRYPDISIPEKNPMPRPVDKYFERWSGPERKEFKDLIEMDKMTGNQKWLLWVLERYLNMMENK